MFFSRKKKHSVFAVPVSPRRKKIKVNWRAIFWSLGGILILGGLVYLLIWSPVFKIKSWVVDSANFTAKARAQEAVDDFFQKKLWRVVPVDSWLIFSGGNLRRAILAEFPEAATVRVEKNILKGVKILIEGRQPAAFWCRALAPIILADQATTTNAALPQSDGCFFVDEEGLVFREAPAISGASMPTFFYSIGQTFAPGDKAIASSTVWFASQLKKQLRDADIEAAGFMVGAGGSQELTVFMEEGWQAYFDLGRPVQSQVKILSALLADELKEKRAALKYVDMRVAGKVYYR